MDVTSAREGEARNNRRDAITMAANIFVSTSVIKKKQSAITKVIPDVWRTGSLIFASTYSMQAIAGICAQLPAMWLWGGRWVAATVLRAKIG